MVTYEHYTCEQCDETTTNPLFLGNIPFCSVRCRNAYHCDLAVEWGDDDPADLRDDQVFERVWGAGW